MSDNKNNWDEFFQNENGSLNGFSVERVDETGETIGEDDEFMKIYNEIKNEEEHPARSENEAGMRHDRSANQKTAPESPAPAPKEPANYAHIDDEHHKTGMRQPQSDARQTYPAGRKKYNEFELTDEELDYIDDLPEEYKPVKAVKKNNRKRTGCLGGVMYFMFVICISFALACIGWVMATDVLALGRDSVEVTVTLEKDMFHDEEVEVKDEEGNVTGTKQISVADIGDVANVLYDNGLIKYKALFRLYASFSHADQKVSAGTYVLKTNYDYRALVSGMTTSAGVKVEVKVTIPEGYTLKQTFELLEEKEVCSAEDLWDAAANYDFDYDFLSKDTLGDKKRLEGYLFPDTYKFYMNDTPYKVINKFLKNFDNRWTEEFDERLTELGYTQRDIIIIASMIEKEAGADSERATMASVIYNRLENPNASTVGLLQMDSTISYIIAETGQEFSTDIDNPYNTYKYKGLPVGAISNPGLASIKAALYPENTSYFYFALNLSGTHNYFKNYDSFIAFVNSSEYGG